MNWQPRSPWSHLFFAALVVVPIWAPGWAAAQAVDRDKPLAAFFGTYEGQTVFETALGFTKRDLNVVVAARGRGFSVQWTTVTQKSTGKIKRADYTINFQPAGRPGVFAADMRTDRQGAEVPLDPLKGDPYVWARIGGATLTVFALIITEDGGYEMQTYDRTVTDDGMNLRFARVRNGDPLKLIRARLIRKK